MARSGRAGALLAPLFVFAGCNAVLGISDDPVLPGAAAEACVLNSDCAEPFVCLFESCSPPCAADRDCDDGERCFRTTNGTYCAEHERTKCDATTSCPAKSTCNDGVCRNSCKSDEDCQGDQVCTAGYCVGEDSEHDPASLTPCKEGAIRCEGRAQALRSICEDGAWVPTEPCEGGQLCDSQSDPTGECADVEDECFGKMPDEFSCDGSKRMTCGPDLVTVEVEECLSPRHCAEGVSGCAKCLPNQYRCDGQDLSVCNDEGTGFDHVETCDDDDPCNAEAGACTRFACLKEQKRCVGGLLQECNSDQSAFETVEDCGEGLCDSGTLTCDVCLPNTAVCKAGSDVVVACNADGTEVTETDCSQTDAPFCKNGACTECLSESDCDAGPCTVATCNGGTCGTVPVVKDNACTGEAGYCDGAGACHECNKPEHCLPTSGECYLPTCNQHECGEAPKDAGAPCSGGKYCNGSGGCVACLTAAHCGAQQVCRTGSCVDAEHIVPLGFDSPTSFTAGDATIAANEVYTFLLPQLAHPAKLVKFGYHGHLDTGLVRMAIYEGVTDSFGEKRPTGSPLAEMPSAQAWGDTAKEFDPSPANITLEANKDYWLAIRSNANLRIRTKTNTASLGWSYTGLAGFGTISAAGAHYNGVDWNIFIRVLDTQ
jgi:hypothetical protein